MASTARSRGRHARPPKPPSSAYGAVLASPGFRALLGADMLSRTGDQIARIALALLVFSRTGSASLTAATFAVTYLPWLVGGPLLSTLADRYPRRTVMVTCDAVRAALVAVMAWPGAPLTLLFGLVFLVTVLEPPFLSARSALLPDLLGEERYGVGLSISLAVGHVTQVAGFAVGGVLVGALSPQAALWIDAGTFAASAVLVARLPRQAPRPHGTKARLRLLADASSGARLVFGNPVTRHITLLAWTVAGFSAVPDGLAVVYSDAHGGGAMSAGLLTATVPLGLTVGALGLTRWLPRERRRAAMLPLAAAELLLLSATVLDPPLLVTGVLWTVAGIGGACLITANELFVDAVPPERRGAAFGVTGTGVFAAQGLAIAVSGTAADAFAVGPVIGVGAAIGLLGVAALALASPARRTTIVTTRAQVPEAA